MKIKHFYLSASFIIAVLFVSCTKDQIDESTIENIKESVTRELHATIAYNEFSIQAEFEGLNNVAKLFKALSIAEETHAKIFLNILVSHNQKMNISIPKIKVDYTVYNLQKSIKNEILEIDSIYPAIIWQAISSNQETSLIQFYHIWKSEQSHKYLLAYIYDRFITIPAPKESKSRETLPSVEDLIDLDINSLPKMYYVCPDDGIIYDDLNVPIVCDSSKTPMERFIIIE